MKMRKMEMEVTKNRLANSDKLMKIVAMVIYWSGFTS